MIFEKYGTQWDFAKAAGIHESRVSRVVEGRRTLTKAERREWAELLGTDSSELWEEDVSNG